MMLGKNNNKVSKENKTHIGVGVMILKDGKVLLGKRKGKHGAGEYGFPGGHLEVMESFEDCARRETLEECGISIKNLRFLFVANVTGYYDRHYVHIGFIADFDKGEPKVLEPEKCESWEWFEMDSLPNPIFTFSEMAFDAMENKKNYYDSN